MPHKADDKQNENTQPGTERGRVDSLCLSIRIDLLLRLGRGDALNRDRHWFTLTANGKQYEFES